MVGELPNMQQVRGDIRHTSVERDIEILSGQRLTLVGGDEDGIGGEEVEMECEGGVVGTLHHGVVVEVLVAGALFDDLVFDVVNSGFDRFGFVGVVGEG